METLLVIDDEPNVLYSLGKALGADGLRVLTAATAAEGVEAVRGYKPDAVILDVRLPDFTGLEAFDRMRAIDPRLPAASAVRCTWPHNRTRISVLWTQTDHPSVRRPVP